MTGANMNSWRIRTRTGVLGVLPTLVTSLLLTFYFVTARFSDIDAELKRRGDLIASQLAYVAEYGVAVGNQDMLEAHMDAVLTEPDVVYVDILDTSGAPIVNRRSRKDAPAASASINTFLRPIRRQSLPTDAFDDPFLAAPSAPRSDTLGSVVIALSNEQSVARQSKVMIVALGLGSLSLALSLLIAQIIARSITEPIRTLSSALRRIKDGNFNVRVIQRSGGEIGSLETDVNAMAESLAAAREAELAHTQGLMRAREAAEATTRAKSQFLANMSHELRTPMNGTLGMLQLLQNTALNSEQNEYVSTACESTEHLLRVVNDILDFSKIEDGKLTLEQVWFNARQLVHRSISAFNNEARLKQIELRMECVGDLQDHELLGDPTRIRQVLVNLLGNAVKFTEQGHVRLRAIWDAQDDDQLQLTLQVEDTGVGIPEAKLASVFEAFTQADGSTTRRHGGTGLGLSICKQLCQLMGGDIRVKSAPGVGSVFTVTLPLRYRLPVSDEQSRPLLQRKLQFRGRVLLVEDNHVNQAVTRGLLQHFGLEVECAADGESALRLIDSKRYDLVLMDCQMPVLDGYEATRRWREREHSSEHRLPIIALTANAMEGDRERCLAAGMDDYLSKPISRDALAQCLGKWLSTSGVDGA